MAWNGACRSSSRCCRSWRHRAARAGCTTRYAWQHGPDHWRTISPRWLCASSKGTDMTDIPIRLTCADYARVMPLAVGAVKPAGIDLTMVLGQEGSWSARAEMLRRAASDPDVQGGESSMAGHLRRVDKGDRSLVALPVFPLRNFTGRDLYVRKDGPIKTATDLRGRRVGMYDWVASGSIWYRHFLRFVGVQPEDVHWCIGPVDEGNIT